MRLYEQRLPSLSSSSLEKDTETRWHVPLAPLIAGPSRAARHQPSLLQAHLSQRWLEGLALRKKNASRKGEKRNVVFVSVKTVPKSGIIGTVSPPMWYIIGTVSSGILPKTAPIM
jgi:hypothetical protein